MAGKSLGIGADPVLAQGDRPMGEAAPVVLLSQRLGGLTAHERRLEAAGAEVRSALLATESDIAGNARDADVLIVGAVEPFSRAALAALPRIGGIVRRGVGYDNIDIAAATEAGIVVANVPDASVDEVAEHALACLLALERHLGLLDDSLRAGMWRSAPGALQDIRNRPRRLSELTLGIVGFGRIGSALARKAEHIYRRTLVHDVAVPTGTSPRGVTFTTLADLLATSDHISLHLPMSQQNRDLIGAQEIAAMRPGTVLVNTARGGLVDENALAAAVAAGHLLAALDVTEPEPFDPAAAIAAAGLRGRLLLTGHSAAWSQTATTILADNSVEAAARLIRGERPSSIVNLDVLSSQALRITALREGRPA